MAIAKIAPNNEKNICTAGETCICEFSVSNTFGRPLLCGLQIKSQDNVGEWINVEGTIERKIEEDMDATIALKISPPVDLVNQENSPKTYAFRLRIYNVNQPEDIVDSPTVSVTVNAVKTEKKNPFLQLWALAAILAVLIIGVVFWLFQSPAGEKYTFVNAEQVSDHPSGYGAAENAIDGNTAGQWQDNKNNTLSGTSGRAGYEWWQGDLGKFRDIGQIVVHLRTDCCERWKKEFHIFIADEKMSGSPLDLVSAKKQAHVSFNYRSQEPLDEYVWETPDETRGRYLVIMTTPSAKQAFSSEKAELVGQINSLNREAADVDNQVNQTKMGIASAEKTLSDSKKQLSSIDAQIASYQKAVADLKNTIPPIEKNISKTKAARSDVKKAIAKQSPLVRPLIEAQLLPKLNSIELQLKLLMNAKNEVTGQIADSEKRIVALRKNKTATEKQIADAEIQRVKFKNDQIAFEKQKIELKQENTVLAKQKAIYDKEEANSFLSLAEVEVFSPEN